MIVRALSLHVALNNNLFMNWTLNLPQIDLGWVVDRSTVIRRGPWFLGILIPRIKND